MHRNKMTKMFVKGSLKRKLETGCSPHCNCIVQGQKGVLMPRDLNKCSFILQVEESKAADCPCLLFPNDCTCGLALWFLPAPWAFHAGWWGNVFVLVASITAVPETFAVLCAGCGWTWGENWRGVAIHFRGKPTASIMWLHFFSFERQQLLCL